MSRGNPIVRFRVSSELLERMEDHLDAYNSTTRSSQIDMSEWIRMAVREKLDHAVRAKRQRERRRIRKLIGATESA